MEKINMGRPKDSTIEHLKDELKDARDDNKKFGTNDYRRGFIDGLVLAIRYRRSALKRGTK